MVDLHEDYRLIQAVFAYLCLVAVMSGVAFSVYGYDKRCAVCGTRRVPEKTLHVLSLVGGWPGAWYAQRHFRHKTQKTSFLIMFWATVVLHTAVVAGFALGLIDSSLLDVISRSQ